MSGDNKSPIKDKPLRLPGQSLVEAREKLFEDAFDTPVLMAVFMIVMAALEWARLYWDIQPSPVIFSIAASFMIGFAVWRIWQVYPQVQALKQGIEGEKAVGQFLERLREDGYQVFHDVVGVGFNVDHVLIGPAGVFTIETKTWSKPAKGEARISFDGLQLMVNGRKPDRAPIVQARAQTAWLKSLLLESTGRTFDVFPVVLFPGWYIEQSNSSLNTIWVLEPKALTKFLKNKSRALEAEDVNLASYHLSRSIRSNERDAKLAR